MRQNMRQCRRNKQAPRPDRRTCFAARSPCTAARAGKRCNTLRKPFSCCHKAWQHGAGKRLYLLHLAIADMRRGGGPEQVAQDALHTPVDPTEARNTKSPIAVRVQTGARNNTV